MSLVLDSILNILLGLIGVGAIVSMVRFHQSEVYKTFNLIDIVTCQKGHVSRPAIMEFGAWVVATWGFVVLINQGKLSEWYMGAYIGAFVLRAGYSAFLGSKNGTQPR